MLAKSNMAEFAWSPMETVNSLIPGHTRNPYALDRVPAGSSGGTAAAVAASFGAVGLGTDTGNSIRGPSSHTSLAGIRPTMGLASRGGIVPLFLNRDVGGPMARTMADAAAVLDVIVGHDPADPVTAASEGRRPESYLRSLDPKGLRDARIGVLRQLFMGPSTDPEILGAMERALADMARQGAVIVEGIGIPELDQSPRRGPSATASSTTSSSTWRGSARRRRSRPSPRSSRPSGSTPRSSGGCARRRASRRRTTTPGAGRPTRTAGGWGPPCSRRWTSPAGRAGVPVVEQPAAADRRPQHASRQHQSPDIAADGLPRGHGADGVRPRDAAGGVADPRPALERADADQDRLRATSRRPSTGVLRRARRRSQGRHERAARPGGTGATEIALPAWRPGAGWRRWPAWFGSLGSTRAAASTTE